MFVEKVFNWLCHFLRICILLVKKILIFVLNDLQIFFSFFAYEYKNFAVFYIDFKSKKIIGKKCLKKKLFAKNFSKLV
jgi:hypothetical protein